MPPVLDDGLQVLPVMLQGSHATSGIARRKPSEIFLGCIVSSQTHASIGPPGSSEAGFFLRSAAGVFWGAGGFRRFGLRNEQLARIGLEQPQ